MAGVTQTLALAMAGAALVIWFGLMFGWHRFWTIGETLERAARKRRGEQDLTAWPCVIAVVPARNEAEHIETTLTALAGQDYDGDFRIVVVDDGSDDDTAAVVNAVMERHSPGRITLAKTDETAPGWAGKVWAMQTGVEQADKAVPDYYWFSDADIEHAPEALRSLVAVAVAKKLSLTSAMVLLRSRSLWERLMIPAFVFYFKLLYPFARVNDPASRFAAAAGGSMLVRRDSLEAVGGLAAIQGALIDDCALAKAIKGHGGAIWLGLTRLSRSLRAYDRLGDIVAMVSRSAYVQLGHSPLVLVLTLTGLALTHVAPAIIAADLWWRSSPAGWLAAATVFIMALCYSPLTTFYRRWPMWAFTLPIAATLFMMMTWISAWRYHAGKSAQWRGREVAPRKA